MAGDLRYEQGQRVHGLTRHLTPRVFEGIVVQVRPGAYDYEIEIAEGARLLVNEREVLGDLPASNAWPDVEAWLDQDGCSTPVQGIPGPEGARHE